MSSGFSSIVQTEILELEGMIYKFKEQLDFQRRRADNEERRANDAERRLKEYAEHLAKVNQARLVAQQEANKANEELRQVDTSSLGLTLTFPVLKTVQAAAGVCTT